MVNSATFLKRGKSKASVQTGKKETLIQLYNGQPVMKAIHHEQLIDLVGPVFEERGFGQIFFYILFVFGRKRDPDALRFHGHDIVVDNALFYQPVDISTMWRHQRRELIVHVKLYGHLEFSHSSSS